jgi:hypothetical protein
LVVHSDPESGSVKGADPAGRARPQRLVPPDGLVPIERFTQQSQQEHIEIVSFGVWSETENPVTPGAIEAKAPLGVGRFCPRKVLASWSVPMHWMVLAPFHPA